MATEKQRWKGCGKVVRCGKVVDITASPHKANRSVWSSRPLKVPYLSVINKMPDLQLLVGQVKPDIVSITETWLSSVISD